MMTGTTARRLPASTFSSRRKSPLRSAGNAPTRPTTTSNRSARSCARCRTALPARRISSRRFFPAPGSSAVWRCPGPISAMSSAALGPNHSPMALMIGLGTAALLPIIFFFGVAHMAWRSQELRLIAQSMAQVAMRLAEPESVAREFDRHGRTGDPPRSRRHGRRRGAGAGAGERTRSDGAQRSGGARTHLQRQRGAHPRPAAGSRQPARHAGRPGRTGALRHQQRAHRSDAGFVDHQRSRRPAGQRGGRTHHPLARREGRAHHGGARADRRQYDPAAERARRRPDRAPGRRQRRDRACARDGQ